MTDTEIPEDRVRNFLDRVKEENRNAGGESINFHPDEVDRFLTGEVFRLTDVRDVLNELVTWRELAGRSLKAATDREERIGELEEQRREAINILSRYAHLSGFARDAIAALTDEP